MAVGFGSSSPISGSAETFECESLPLSRIRVIEDGVSRFQHVVREEESARDRVRPIRNRRLRYHHASIKVHRPHLNLNGYKSSDQWLRLKCFKMNSSLNQIPPHTPSLKWRLTIEILSHDRTLHISPWHLRTKIEKHHPKWQKWKGMSEYIRGEWLMRLAKILKRVLILINHIHAHTCTQAHTHTLAHAHVCATWCSHMSPRGAIFLHAPRQLVRQHAIKNSVFYSF